MMEQRRCVPGLVLAVWLCSISCAMSFRSHPSAILSDAYLRGLMNRLGDKLIPEPTIPDIYVDYQNYDDSSSSISDPIESEIKEYEEAPESLNEQPMRERSGLGLSLRDQEYLKHSSLFASAALHQQDQSEDSHKGSEKGSAGLETASPSSPTGSSSSGKSENVLPAYCNPPNPCPIGYTAEDGCLEEFENTAAFSREYQASQDCMCDTEHMFDCPASSLGNPKSRANAKNRAAANMVDSAIRKIMSDLQQGEHKSLVSKKFFDHDKFVDELSGMKERAQKAARSSPFQYQSDNPYLQGDKLPIAAKKGNRVD